MSTLTEDLKKTAVDAGYVVVGITDLAVERARGAQAQLVQVRDEVRTELAADKIQARVKAVPAQAKTLPTTAVSKGLEAAGKVEEGFDDLAGRGKSLVERIRKQRATQDLVQQGRTTLTRTKAAVTTVRRGAKDTEVAAKGAVTSARKDAATSVDAASKTAKKATAKRTTPAAKRTATTAKKRTAASKTATKGATTSARKTATQAVKAASAAADKVGS
jgi:heparin binding hemagglutinin HbhA